MEILYLVIAKTFGTVKGYAMKRAGEKATGGDNSLCINLLRTLICLVVSIGVWCVSGMGFATPLGNLIVVISGISNALNLYFWILSAQMISISLLEVFCMLGSVILPLVLAPVLYNGDSVSLIQWLGCAALLIAMLLFTSQEKSAEGGNPLKKLIYLFFCVAGVGGVSITQKMYVYHVSDKGLGTIAYFNLGTFVCVALLFSAVFAVRELLARAAARRGVPDVSIPSKSFPLKKVIVYVAVAAISLYAYQYFNTLASTLDSAILYPVTYALGMIGSVVLDTFFFGHKLTKKRIIALVFVAIAIVLVNLKL